MIHSLIRSMRANLAADLKQREHEDNRQRQLKVPSVTTLPVTETECHCGAGIELSYLTKLA